MLSPGQRFREQREKQKVSLDAIAARTKINPRYLQAIETENFDDLPAGLFRRSFIRQYADALNLSWAELEPELKDLLELPERSDRQSRSELPEESAAEDVSNLQMQINSTPEAPREHRMAWAVGLLIFAMVSCSGIYALWQHTQEPDLLGEAALVRQPVSEVQPPPLGTSDPVPQASVAEPPAPVEPPAIPDPVPATAPPETPKPKPTAENELSEAARLKALPQPDPAPVVPPVESKPVEPPAALAEMARPKANKIVVEVSANENVWVRMTADRQTVFRGMLEPQQSKSFEGVGRTRVLVGDAGAVSITWNGKSIGPVGQSGQIRVIEFTPDTFQILSH